MIELTLQFLEEFRKLQVERDDLVRERDRVARALERLERRCTWLEGEAERWRRRHQDLVAETADREAEVRRAELDELRRALDDCQKRLAEPRPDPARATEPDTEPGSG